MNREEIGFYGWPDRDTWFEALQPGDTVIEETRFGVKSDFRTLTVKGRTPSGKVRLENGDMYDSWGRIVIGSAFSKHIRPVTDTAHDALERQYFLQRIAEVDMEQLPLETLRKIVGILRGQKGRAAPK